MYIGETGRPIQDRIKQHDRDIRLARNETSAVSEHAHNTGHKPLWNDVKFIDRDPYYYTHRVKELIHIRLHPNKIKKNSWSQQSIMLYKITHDQSTSSPEEDWQYAVETSRSTSNVTTSWDKWKIWLLLLFTTMNNHFFYEIDRHLFLLNSKRCAWLELTLHLQNLHY